MYRKITSAILASALLLPPLQTFAQENARLIELKPPAEMSSAASVGKLSLCCDASMYGSQFELHLHQEEGDLLYYAFTASYLEAVQVDCPLMKDGDYQLVVKLPQDNSSEYQSYSYLFHVEDPDPADRPSDFDTTKMIRYFTVDSKLDSDVADEKEPVLTDRIYQSESRYAFARRAFTAGDINTDGNINAMDATMILISAAAQGIGKPSGLSSLQTLEGDLNNDSVVNSKDATIVLSYAAARGISAFDGSIQEFVVSRNMQ